MLADLSKLQKDLKPLTNVDIIKLAEELDLKKFRGVFMRDTLPEIRQKEEVGIVNLDTSKNIGTHWVCYKTDKNQLYYFDSFGLDPPSEIIKYLKSNTSNEIIISTFQIQKFNTTRTSHKRF